jgi:hypothetical protein
MLAFSIDTKLFIQAFNRVDDFGTTMGEIFPVNERFITNNLKYLVKVLFDGLNFDLAHDVENNIN